MVDRPLDAFAAFYVDSDIKKRYDFLRANKRLSKRYMADELRRTYEKVVEEAEKASGYKRALKDLSKSADEKRGGSDATNTKAPVPPFLKENTNWDSEHEAQRERGVV